MHPMLNTAIKAARRAGAIINRASLDLERLNVARKGPKDYVTEVDQAAEEAIIDILRTAYPEHAFLGEETGEHAALVTHEEAAGQPSDVPPAVRARSTEDRGQPEFRWVIDPLDGTTNFIHGVPHYAVSVALMHRGVAAHAVVFDPTRNEMFTASRGSGAFLNDRRVRVSSLARYHDALLSSHIPRSTALPASSPFTAMLSDCGAARRTGSTVLDLAWVACGRLDGFCGSGLKPWDMAGGGLLALESGALVTDFDGEQNWMRSGNVLAANPKIFAQMMAHLRA